MKYLRWFVVGSSTACGIYFVASLLFANYSAKATLREACSERPSQYRLSPGGFRALVHEFETLERGRRTARVLGSENDSDENRLPAMEAARAFQVSRSSLQYRADPVLPSLDSDIWKRELELYLSWERLGFRCERLQRQAGRVVYDRGS